MFLSQSSLSLIDPHALQVARQHPEYVVTVSSSRLLSHCPRKFSYRYSVNAVKEDSLSIRTGSKIHSILESLYRGDPNAKNDGLLTAFVKEWDDLVPIAIEEPFLFWFGDVIVGGVIDLLAQSKSGIYVVDHKISTGQYLSQIPIMTTREQLGIYTFAVRKFGIYAEGGILSRMKLQQDTKGLYVNSLSLADGVDEYPGGTLREWGYTRYESNRLIRALLVHSEGKVLRVEREYMELSNEELMGILQDLVTCWQTLYGQEFRVRGAHCNICIYNNRCQEDARTGTSAPNINVRHLHPELTRRIVELEEGL